MSQSSTQSTPRGIRLNNPGNIVYGEQWRGMAADQKDPRFITFLSPEYGIRALARVLLNYQRKHGLNTVEGIITRYAPPFENNTKAYVAAVARACNVEPNAVIDVADLLPVLVPAIIKHENGRQPYDQATIDKGIALALEG